MERQTKINNLFEYIKQNRLYVFGVYFCFFVFYGIWSFQDFVSFDAEGLYSASNAIAWYQQWIGLGRWALVFLKKILGVWIINPFFSMIVFMICFPLSVILWNYLFEKWNGGKIKGILVFDLLYLTHPIWAYQFAYRNQIEVITIMMCLLPIFVNVLCEWLEDHKWYKGLLAFIGIVFCFAGYQSFLILYVESILVYFFLQIRNNKLDKKEFYQRLFKVVLFSLVAFLGYQLSCKISCLVSQVNKEEYASYLSNQIPWLQGNLLEFIHTTLSNVKRVLLGGDNTYSCIYFVEWIIAIILYIKNITQKPQWNVWIGIILSLMFVIPLSLNIVTAGASVIRQEFALVFSIAFIGMYEIDELCSMNRMKQAICVVVIGAFLINQVQLLERLLYSDYKVMQSDYDKMVEIYYKAKELGATYNSTIVFVGGQDFYANDQSIIRNEVIGFSYFLAVSIAPNKLTQAMQAYGFPVCEPNDTQRQRAYELAKDLQIWPNENSICVEDDLIVVRLGDF